MNISVPTEIKLEENRVALTPAGAAALTAHGHSVFVQRGAGAGSSLPDALYIQAGATIVAEADETWAGADLVLKVKEPVAEEYSYLRADLGLFTYLHLAADENLTRALLDSGTTALAYETLQLDDRSLPLLAPMSEVAGRLAVQVGSWCLQHQNGGRGVLLSGVAGVKPGKVVIVGAGISGTSACQVAVGIGADVTILDINPTRLRYVHDILGGHITTVMSNQANLEEEVRAADLVIGAVLIPGARAPRLISRELVDEMRTGAAIVDISIDQGGIAATSRVTTHAEPVFTESGVVHYAVANMPGIVPHTSTQALTSSTLHYVMLLADQGIAAALEESAPLRRALNIDRGRIVHPGVSAAFPDL
ncbi:MAG: alanine dehydrogenase [Deltaproteobacteria bacterium]